MIYVRVHARAHKCMHAEAQNRGVGYNRIVRSNKIPSSPLSLSSLSLVYRGSRPCEDCTGSSLSRYLASPLLNSSDMLLATNKRYLPSDNIPFLSLTETIEHQIDIAIRISFDNKFNVNRSLYCITQITLMV